MKVRINYDGELVISGENDLELYALQQWARNNEDICSTSETGSDKNIVILDGVLE